MAWYARHPDATVATGIEARFARGWEKGRLGARFARVWECGEMEVWMYERVLYL